VQRFLYQNGQLVPTPGEVWAINDRGHAVGDVLYAGGRTIDIPDLSISTRGDIVGSDQDAGRQPVNGGVGTPGNLRSLMSLLVDGTCWFVIEPLAVNDAGYIARRTRAAASTRRSGPWCSNRSRRRSNSDRASALFFRSYG
jgi:hypothetical protein